MPRFLYFNIFYLHSIDVIRFEMIRIKKVWIDSEVQKNQYRQATAENMPKGQF